MESVVEDFRKRLMEFVSGHLELSVRRFEESCGLANGQIAGSKVKGPSLEVLSKILDTYPDLNLNWLVGGKGPMIVPREGGVSQNDIHHNHQVFIGNWDSFAEILADKLKGK